MIRLDLVDNNYSKKYTLQYELSILIGVDSFAYMVTSAQQEVLALKDYTLAGSQMRRFVELENIYQEDPKLNASYRSMRIGFKTKSFTFIPNRLFKESEKKSYLDHLQQVHPNDQIRVDHLQFLSIRNVYSIPAKLYEFTHRKFNGARSFHVNTALLGTLYSLATRQGESQLYLHVRPNEVQFFLFKEGILHYVNSFDYQSEKDFIYYVLLVFDQFQLKQDQLPVFLSGHLMPDSEIYKLLGQYIKNVQFIEAPAFFRFGPAFQKHPNYLYFDLLSLALSK